MNPEKALIWRIVHIDNLPWIFSNGLHCGNSVQQSPSYTSIGHAELIGKRTRRDVLVAPGGTLADYVPFYFTPFSPMMYNILTGRGVKKRDKSELCILVSSLKKVESANCAFVFTDRHAYLSSARFFNQITDLGMVDWTLLQSRDFKRDANDPEKVERYQAEALVYQQVPISALIGVVCHDQQTKVNLDVLAQHQGLLLDVRAMPSWYF